MTEQQQQALSIEMEKDARRYRWLRDNWFTMAATYLDDGVQFYTRCPRYSNADESLLDAAIDAEMAKGE